MSTNITHQNIQITADGVVVFTGVGSIYSTIVEIDEDTIPGGAAKVVFQEPPKSVTMADTATWASKNQTSVQFQFEKTFEVTESASHAPTHTLQVITDNANAYSGVGSIYSTAVAINEGTTPGGIVNVVFRDKPRAVKKSNRVSEDREKRSIQVQFNQTLRTTEDL